MSKWHWEYGLLQVAVRCRPLTVKEKLKSRDILRVLDDKVRLLFLFRRARWDFESCNSDYVVHDRAARADIRSRAFCHVELIWVLILR